ncbi:MAG: hypothetical protein AB8C95_03100 [Phycisphaeraceae bacterium]
MVIYIVISIFVIIIAGIGAYYLAQLMKGKLELELTHSSAYSDDLISGIIKLEAKRHIHGFLQVSLVGYVERTKRDSENMKTTEHIEVYRFDQVLERTRDFNAGFQQNYPFDLIAPNHTEVRTAGSVSKTMAANAGDETTGDRSTETLANLPGGRVHWHVESRLDSKGVDLYTKEKCTVTLKD